MVSGFACVGRASLVLSRSRRLCRSGHIIVAFFESRLLKAALNALLATKLEQTIRKSGAKQSATLTYWLICCPLRLRRSQYL